MFEIRIIHLQRILDRKTDINQNGGRLTIEKQQIEELRQKYIQNPPEGMTAKLVKNMSDSDLLDMHYFLIEDDDLEDGNIAELEGRGKKKLGVSIDPQLVYTFKLP